MEQLHYARWDAGEVDIVWVDAGTQKPEWCVEVKWSDSSCKDARNVKNVTEFAKKNGLKEAYVTTKTLSQKGVFDGVTIVFEPSAVYTYALGANILNNERGGRSSQRARKEAFNRVKKGF